MHVAEMDFEVAPELRAALAKMVAGSDLGYLGPLPELEQAFGDFASSRWGWRPQRPQFRIATDVGVAAVELLRHLVNPGQGVVISSPVYSSFHKWIEEVGAEQVDVPLRRVDDDWLLDLDAIEVAFSAGHRVYLLCHPHNPVGRIHSAEELRKLAALADKYGAVVISDEIHAPLSWSDFAPFLGLGPQAEQVGITISSTSKGWNTAGLKAAFVLTEGGNHRELLARLPEAMHWRSSLLGAMAMVVSYRACGHWLDDTVARVRANFELLRAELQRQLPAARLASAQSTYLAWIDLSAFPTRDWAAELLRDQRLAVVSGADHGADGYTDFIRLNVATSGEWVTEAVARLAKLANLAKPVNQS